MLRIEIMTDDEENLDLGYYFADVAPRMGEMLAIPVPGPGATFAFVRITDVWHAPLLLLGPLAPVEAPSDDEAEDIDDGVEITVYVALDEDEADEANKAQYEQALDLARAAREARNEAGEAGTPDE
jgi:hypothetical protein